MFMEKFIEPELTFMELQYEEIITASNDGGADLGEEGWEIDPVNPQNEDEENS